MAAACCVVVLITLPAVFKVPNVFERDTVLCISNMGLCWERLLYATDLCLGQLCKVSSEWPSILRKAIDLILNTSFCPCKYPTKVDSFIRRSLDSNTVGCSINPIIPSQIPRQIGSSASVKCQSAIRELV